jgi:hypothetical protein
MVSLKGLARVTAPVLAGLSVLAAPGIAGADPAAPSPPPYVDLVPYAYPGSYQYFYNLIPVMGPATTDARGIRATTNADPAMSAEGLPGSQLGLSPNKVNGLGTYTSTRNNISAGPAPAQIVQPGIAVGAGNQMPTVEDPSGAPPKNPPGAESSQPTSAPAVPGNSQILENPGGQPTGSSPAPSAAAPPATVVWPQTSGFAPGAPGTGPGPSISAGQ